MYAEDMSTQSIDYTLGGNRIAVIGGGISGLVASHLISRKNTVVLFESEATLGGHTYTVNVPQKDGTTLPVDIGFIVFNDPNYPTFRAFLKELEVESDISDMSFAYHDPSSGFMYAGTGVQGMLSRWQNIFSPVFWRMLLAIPRFSKEARRDLDAGRLTGRTIGEYLDANGYNKDFEENYLLPMAGAIWSAPEGLAREFPAEALVRFFENHALLDYRNRPPWRYIKGGSAIYVRAFERAFQGEVRTNTLVTAVRRNPDGVVVSSTSGDESFDAVVLATHADITRDLLRDPDESEKKLFSPWSYAPNRVVLHSDSSFLPPKAAAQASWNFVRDMERNEDAPVGVSYHMNRLQKLQNDSEYVVTLNPVREPKAGTVTEDVVLDHPQFTIASMETQKSFSEIQGNNRTFFCGAYQGYGFHEDGARSGALVAEHFGERL
jgi:predicted NAD/FAD-binding protein